MWERESTGIMIPAFSHQSTWKDPHYSLVTNPAPPLPSRGAEAITSTRLVSARMTHRLSITDPSFVSNSLSKRTGLFSPSSAMVLVFNKNNNTEKKLVVFSQWFFFFGNNGRRRERHERNSCWQNAASALLLVTRAFCQKITADNAQAFPRAGVWSKSWPLP